VRQYIEQAAPLVDIAIDGDVSSIFSFRPLRLGAMDTILPKLELYPEEVQDALSVSRPGGQQDVIWLHPGEPVFEAFRALVSEHLSDQGARGAVFVDPSADKPYLFHMALLTIMREVDSELTEFAKEEIVNCRLVGVKQYEGAEISTCPVEHLLLLRGGRGLPASAQRLAATANSEKELSRAFLLERVAREMALVRRQQILDRIPEAERLLLRGFDYQEAELASARAKHAEKAKAGNRKAIDALEDVKRRQRQLATRREHALLVLRREPDLITPDELKFVAHALVVPSSEPADREQHEADVESVAMKVARAYEEAAGAEVFDVHTPELARVARLPDNPGFDLLSIRSASDRRSIEVKGRAETGDVEVTANEWAKACNMGEKYWLYAVYDCGTPNPRLIRVQDPFARLLARAKGSVLIGRKQIMEASE
jgi:hypothetical protein